MKKSLLALFLTTGLTLFCNATEVPSPVRGQFYPIYNNWMDPTVSQVPLNKVNVTFACFAHVYNSTDGTIHWSVPGANGSLTPPATASNSILGYENARNGASPTTNDYDYDRIQKIVTAAHATPGNKVLISLGWGGSGSDWSNINTDMDSPNPQFVNSVVEFIKVNNLDGFDIDFESVMYITKDNFNKLCQQLRTALGDQYILSITPYQTSFINETNLKCFDMINVQTYYQQYQDYYDIMREKLVPENKIAYGTCEDSPDTHDFAGAVDFAKSKKGAGVFNWQMQDDQIESTLTYTTPSGGSVTYQNFPSVNYFYDYMK